MLSHEKIPEECLIPWKFVIFSKADKNNSKLKTRIKPSISNPILKQRDVISCLEVFQKMFVFLPTDKATKYIAIVCKLYYVELILNEIGVIGHGKNTCCKANESCDEILDENTEYTKRLGYKITEKEKTLPITHRIPKMHKNPTGARFIIVSKYAAHNKVLNLFPMFPMFILPN